MGVDASYLYGYGADINEIEWDIEYLREKYKDIFHEYINLERTHLGTWAEFIFNLSEALENEDYELSEVLDSIDFLCEINYDDEHYLTFNHTHIMKLYPDSKLKDLDDTAKLYAKELGVKNIDDIKWIEWGYFS